MPKNGDETKGTKMLEWEHNCVLQALSKVLGKSVFELANELVSGKIGGVTNAQQIENSSVIKKVLAELKFTPLKVGGCSWKDARQLMGGQKTKGRFYAVWWHGEKAEDWTDTERKGQSSDHAFAIYCNPTDIEVPVTNMRSFDLAHPKDDEFVSVFIPPTVIPCKKRLVLPQAKGPKDKDGKRVPETDRADRRFQYNS